jgi:hypothetical protein
MNFRHGGRSALLLGLISALLMGTITVNAAWRTFGGSIGDGRVWAWDMTDVCLDAVRAGFGTNRYYDPSDAAPDVDDAVYAYLTIDSGFPDNIQLLVPHKVHPPRQLTPVVTEGGTSLDFYTMLNIPYTTAFNFPVSLEDYSVIPLGTSSGGSTYDGADWTMQDCYLLKGVRNGSFEQARRDNPTRPTFWEGTNLIPADRLMCDKVKVEGKPDKFFSFEAGVVNTASYDIDPDTDPGCAFRFVGKPGKVAALAHKNTDVSDFAAGDTVTLVAYARGITTTKSNVQIKLVVKYPGTNKTQTILATAAPGTKINTGYIEFRGSGQLTGTPEFIRTRIQFNDPSGSLFVDGVYIRLDKAAIELGAGESATGWRALPEAGQ